MNKGTFPAERRRQNSALVRREATARPLADSVLRLIWREQNISRAEIARRTELARSTVSEIVGTLLPTGLVAEIGPGQSRGGRRPIVLQFQDEACSLFGIEMGATHVVVVQTDLRGRVLASHQADVDARNEPVEARALMLELAEHCLRESGRGARSLVGIGVAVPSPVDPRDPDSLSEIVLPAWQGRHGLEVLSERYGVPLLIENDANCGALAERWWGAGRGVEDFAYVKIGTGVGSGHVIGGEVYRGATGVAGEIGHLAIDPTGGQCVCGLRGCLTTFVGTAALTARASLLLEEFPQSELAEKEITISAIEDAALAGDLLALQLTREMAAHLGTALAGMLNLMNPSMVVLEGNFVRLGDLLLAPLRETIEKRTLVNSVAASEVRSTELGPESIAIGAATLILKEALADSRVFPASARKVEAV